MKKATKIVLWGVVAIVLAGGAVGIYFLAKPKDGATRTKKGVSQVYKDGKWEDVVTSGNTTPSNGSGSSTGHKLCWDANVEKLQIYLNSKGAKLEVDGCRGDKTKKAEEKYKDNSVGQDTYLKKYNNGENVYAGRAMDLVIYTKDWEGNYISINNEKINYKRNNYIGKIVEITKDSLWVQITFTSSTIRYVEVPKSVALFL